MTNQIPMTELQAIHEMVHGPSVSPMAFGGAYDGASRFEKQIAGWVPPIQSADMDMLPDKDLLDARSRDLARNDAYVQAGQQIHKDSIVGSFYILNSKPGYKVLGKTQEWGEAFQQEVEEKFTLWAESPMKWVDAAGQNDLTALVRLAVGVTTMGGEVLATVEYIREKGRDYRTAIQMIDADRLSTPHLESMNRSIRGGIRHDRYGRQVSAFIRINHPTDYMRNVGDDWWKEVAFRKPWGRQQVIYLREQNRVDQSRAVADITAGLREIAMTRKFRDVSLQNAVVNATYAASIESELPADVVYQQLGAGGVSQGGVVKYAEDFLSAVNNYVGGARNMMLDGARIPHLFPGTKLNMQPAGTPGGVGQEFERSLLRYIAATVGVSYEELSRDFSSTNYSSARAAMAQTHRFMQSRKKVVADSMANHIFRLWLEEAINNDRLDTFRASEAGMLYTDDHLNLMFDALSQCDWIGAARGQIDELKETQAAVLRIKYGLSTHEDELSRLGKDWRKTYAQLEREAKERTARNIVLYEDNGTNAASGTVREDETDGTEGSKANA